MEKYFFFPGILLLLMLPAVTQLILLKLFFTSKICILMPFKMQFPFFMTVAFFKCLANIIKKPLNTFFVLLELRAEFLLALTLLFFAHSFVYCYFKFITLLSWFVGFILITISVLHVIK